MIVSNPIQTSALADSRVTSRAPSRLRTIVQVKEFDGETWKELTDVTTISRNGAGFSLSRECTVGRLVSLVMPLDRELRAYDENAELYPVMGLVQYCNAATVDGETIYHVGVGFIGKSVPESYAKDPRQSYRITGMKTDGMWEITEATSQFTNRKQPRYWVSIPVTVTLIHKSDKAVIREETVTTNIGTGGVSIASSLDVKIGEKVKFACKGIDFYAIAVVRNRQKQDGHATTLHLEFAEDNFPVEKVVFAR
ncbi:MAG: PilZ domain-containing protein [Pyrinomonadaceae bacterium]